MLKKQLEIVLSQLREIEKPKPELEQYTIPGDLAADILNLAYIAGDVKGKTVVDLGCGSGRLAIGALLMGAKKAIAVDSDKAVLKTAKENVKIVERLTNQKISKKIQFVASDVTKAKVKGDTVIQNPPYGIQKKHADRDFLDMAFKSAKKVYSLHRSYYESRGFISNFVGQRKGKIEKIIKFKFRIPYMFRFHKKSVIQFDVDLFVMERMK